MTEQKNKSLYIPELEKDSCGVGLIANLDGKPKHETIENALTMLTNMEHRGAVGYEENTGDGAGIMTQLPHEFFQKKCREIGFELPKYGEYGVAMVFFPKERELRTQCRFLLHDYIDELGFIVLGSRKVPTDHEAIGDTAINAEPRMEQIFIQPKDSSIEPKELERKLYVLRKYSTHHIHKTFPQSQDLFYISSLSYKTIIYKGQLTTFQVRPYFPDLHDELYKSAIAIVHSRFSTNTVPKWKLAQPFRYIAHNGEINTIRGNMNWWISKEKLASSQLFSDEDLEKLHPICGEALSDSGNFDNVLEFLVLSGRTLPQALMMMVPEAWHHDDEMEDYKKAFYEYHENIMEPWDGPASICFTDGILVGATLDRNGLRPSRYCLTDENVLIVASEAGALPIDQSSVVMKGRLQPGRMLIADLEEQRIIGDDELKERICSKLPYRDWLEKNRIQLEDLSGNETTETSYSDSDLLQKQRLFGYSKEDLKVIIGPMVKNGKDPIGSMGADIPLAILSKRSQNLSHYFKQLFAQVTNPPIDPIRERSVMSLYSRLGNAGNILETTESHAKFIQLKQPVLTNNDVSKLANIQKEGYESVTIDITFKASHQSGRLHAALDNICAQAEDHARNGVNIIILSDRNTSEKTAPIPSLMAVGAVHHHLIRFGLRNNTSIVLEAGDIRETHHFATAIGYGANAINPYMALATIQHLHNIKFFAPELSLDKCYDIYTKAIGKGLLKIMSKNGISTLASYHGAQIFEILGIATEVVNKCFKGSISRIEGIGFDGIAKEVMQKHMIAYESDASDKSMDVGGVYQWKQRGEAHLFNPQTIHLLQYSSRKNDYKVYKKFAKLINEQEEQTFTLRGLFQFRKGDSIPLEEVEPVEYILRRFVTGAMSFGSISHEAHSTLAVALNRIGGKSNSGEGGEDEIRFKTKENGDSEKSATKQVASGRFGVTSNYLTNAKEIQIKMAQGAKPGEGGQLPGHKVDDWIGRVRHSTPGVGLISPPPHHDIYSIEDLAQLIYDLKNANRKARINVKLVSKAGVGIIASGVAKAKADAILISGFDGGTGASPLSSISHAGLPWELGLAETHQTLVKNKLRDRITLQTDGQIRTGKDVAIATLLGAEEYGIATAALVVEGCIMMRKCHLNTCPVGIATQNPDLRKRYTGDPQHVINYLTHIATEMREIMAELGFRSVNDMVGHVELLKVKKDVGFWKYKNLDLSPILYKEPVDHKIAQYKRTPQDHGLDRVLDRKLIHLSENALEEGKPIHSSFKIINTDRSTGTMLSNEISKRYGSKGLPEDTIQLRFRGSAGQSFGAFAAPGLSLTLEGESNDYFGKGLSGAKLVVVPDREAKFDASENIIIGNVAFYGATSGESYIRGMAGERFAVRNSGVSAVVEGIGDHGCEYMTGGRIVILGETGKNFAAGMSGGIAYIYDKEKVFKSKVNTEMVDLDPIDQESEDELRQMVRNHFAYTSSGIALKLLNNWEENLKYFIKVMPRDYKRVLEEKKKKKQNKLSVA